MRDTCATLGQPGRSHCTYHASNRNRRLDYFSVMVMVFTTSPAASLLTTSCPLATLPKMFIGAASCETAVMEMRNWLLLAIILSLIHISEPTRLGMISYAVF